MGLLVFRTRSGSVLQMSETTVESDEQEWPENCPQCGTELETGFVQLERTTDQHGAEGSAPAPPIAQDFCPNPDCPSKGSDRVEPTEPGSLGGDNGGG